MRRIFSGWATGFRCFTRRGVDVSKARGLPDWHNQVRILAGILEDFECGRQG